MGSFIDQFKIKDGLSYLAENKVRIASYKAKRNKKFFNDYLSLINNTEVLMDMGFTVEDIKTMEETRLENRINKLNNHNVDNCLIKNEYTED